MDRVVFRNIYRASVVSHVYLAAHLRSHSRAFYLHKVAYKLRWDLVRGLTPELPNSRTTNNSKQEINTRYLTKSWDATAVALQHQLWSRSPLRHLLQAISEVARMLAAMEVTLRLKLRMKSQ